VRTWLTGVCYGPADCKCRRWGLRQV
jgi:hypothetical protein